MNLVFLTYLLKITMSLFVVVHGHTQHDCPYSQLANFFKISYNRNRRRGLNNSTRRLPVEVSSPCTPQTGRHECLGVEIRRTVV